MKVTTRRDFLAIAGSITGYLASGVALAETNNADTTPYDMVARVDRNRILSEAKRYLSEKPVTVTATRSPRSEGGAHDYFSEGDYWWPDPKHSGGPYIRRDGRSNPDNFNAHRNALIRLSLIVPAFTAAWVLTGERRYADHAGLHLRAWFVDPATRMNANLEYAQAIFGVSKGRGIGIIDTLHLVEPARAATLLMAADLLEDAKDIQRWFADYLEWMRTSKNGQEERDAKNNHGTCSVFQAGEFARFTKNEEVMSWCRERFKSVLVPGQIDTNGSLPLELARTKPYSYSLFDMDVLCGIAQTLSTGKDNLWNFTTPDGRGLRKLMQFMYPYIKDKASWPFSHDVEYFDDFPVRNPALLFSGLAYRKQDYIGLWKKLNPDPVVPEVIRNFPIRQPLLWVTAPVLRSDI